MFCHTRMCAGSYSREVRRGILAAVARVKEGDAQRALEQELLTSVELLEHAAHSAMAALLLVGVFALFVLVGFEHQLGSMLSLFTASLPLCPQRVLPMVPAAGVV